MAQHLPREDAEGKMRCRRNSLYRNLSHKHVFLDSVQLPQDTHMMSTAKSRHAMLLRETLHRLLFFSFWKFQQI